MIFAGTGHRPDKLGGYGDDVFFRLVDLTREALSLYQPAKVFSGMALGYDQALACAAIDLGIPVIAVVPFFGQECKWPHSAQMQYKEILGMCERTVIVSKGGYSPEKMKIRNKWLVEHSTEMLALWDGSSGGTGHCVDLALRNGRDVINLWWRWKEINEY